MEVNDILKWENVYDSSKYPYEVYKELVIEGKEHPRKIEIMGAWKTGCLKESLTPGVYCDKNGKHYVFSDRWKESTPVGYKGWTYISKNQDTLKKQVPVTFPEEQPAIFKDFTSIHRFGFIWSIFALHCWYPKVYPLYDQHVYRAFRYFVSGNKEIPEKAELSWDGYKAYRDFFVQMVKDSKVEFWRVDKSLWAYGKHLASCKPHSEKSKRVSKIRNTSPVDIKDGKSWRDSNTLGYSKSFKWCLTNTDDLIISRVFSRGILKETTIPRDELDKIDRFVTQKDDWVDLANNVDKLAKGTEKDGVGRFLHDQLGKNPTDSQLSSHIGAIFVDAGIWEYRKNRKTRGMQFKKIGGKDWLSTIRDYYESKGSVG